MHIRDYGFLMLLASLVAESFYLGWIAVSIFLAGVFLIFLLGVGIHYIFHPLPRYIIGTATMKDEPDEPEDKIIK